MNRYTGALALAGILYTATAVAATDQAIPSTAADGWNFALSAPELTALCDTTLQRGRQAFSAIEQDTGPATLQSVYGAYQAMKLDLQAIHHVWYMKSVHPDPRIQEAAEACINDYTDFAASQDLSQQFFQRVAAMELESASPAERLMV